MKKSKAKSKKAAPKKKAAARKPTKAKKSTKSKATKKVVKKTAAKKTKPAKKVAAQKTAPKKSVKTKAPTAEPATSAIMHNPPLRVENLELSATGEKLNFNLEEHKGKNVVLYFYPKDATPGCTIEGNEFSKLMPQFREQNTVVFGVSRDDLNSHEKFKANQGFDFELLSDTTESACILFDVIKEKNMYGKKVMGIERSTFLINAEGKLAAEWRKVKAEGHAQMVLEMVKEINQHN